MANSNDLDYDFWRRTKQHDPNEKPWDREWREYNTRQLRHHIDKIVPRDKLAACPKDDERGYLGERGFPLDPAALYHLGLQGPPPIVVEPGEPDWDRDFDRRRPFIGDLVLLLTDACAPARPFLQLFRYTKAGRIPDGEPQPVRNGRLPDGTSIYACDHEAPPPLDPTLYFHTFSEFSIHTDLRINNIHPDQYKHLDPDLVAQELPHPQAQYLPGIRRYKDPIDAQTEPWASVQGHPSHLDKHSVPGSSVEGETDTRHLAPDTRRSAAPNPGADGASVPRASASGSNRAPRVSKGDSHDEAAKTEPQSSGSGPGSPSTDTEPPIKSTESASEAPRPSSEHETDTRHLAPDTRRSAAPDPGADGAFVPSKKNHTPSSHTKNASPQTSEQEPLTSTKAPENPENPGVTKRNNTGQNRPLPSESDTRHPAPDTSANGAPPRAPFTRHQRYVLNHIGMGGTLTTAAEDLHCTPQRFYNWKRRDKHFAAALVEAREFYTKRVADGFHEAESDARILIHRYVNDESIKPHIRLRAALSLMRRNPKSIWLPEPIEPEPDRPSYALIPPEPEDEDPIDLGGQHPSASEAMRDAETEPRPLGRGHTSHLDEQSVPQSPVKGDTGSDTNPQSLSPSPAAQRPAPSPSADGASVPRESASGSNRAPRVSKGDSPGDTAKTEPESLGSGPGSPSTSTVPPIDSTESQSASEAMCDAETEPWSSDRGHTEALPDNPNLSDSIAPAQSSKSANKSPHPTRTEPQSSGWGPGSPSTDTEPSLESSNSASKAMRPTSRDSGSLQVAGARSEPQRAVTPGMTAERSSTMEHLPRAASATSSGHIVAVDRTFTQTAAPPTTTSLPGTHTDTRHLAPDTIAVGGPRPETSHKSQATSHVVEPRRLDDYTVLKGESRKHYRELHAELLRSYQPQSPVEELTVLRLTQVFWVLRRLDGIEAAIWDSEVECRRETHRNIPVVAALALSFLDINENQRTRFQQRLQKMRATHEGRVDELTNQLLRFRQQRESAERHQQRRAERPLWEMAEANLASHRSPYGLDERAIGPTRFDRDATEHLSARINPQQQQHLY